MIKNAYQRAGYSLAQMRMKPALISDLPIRQLTASPNHHFFGYYDKSPWNASDEMILALEVEDSSKAPRPGQLASIGIIDANTLQFNPIAETRTWNFQQGCMLQWLPPGNRDSVVFNDIEDGLYVARRFELDTNDVVSFTHPIYCVSPDGKTALSLDFSRLHRLRPGYGYINIPDRTNDQAIPDSSGITLIDLESGDTSLLLSIRDIVGNESAFPAGTHHWVNHLEFNPGGSRFMFIHRWTDGSVRHSQLMVANSDGGNLEIVANDQLVSHCAWKSDTQILSWSRVGPTGANYHLYDLEYQRATTIGEDVLNVDGHPSYSPDGKQLITDTYPDRERYQNLFQANADCTDANLIARFREPFKYKGEYRCDLHPRWNRSGTKICVDSTHNGTRQMFEIDLLELA